MPNQIDHDFAARNKAILDTAIDAIITIDDKGIVEAVNRAAEKMLGFTLDEMVGNNVSMLMPEPFRGQHDSYMQNYFETGRRKIIGIGREVTARRKDGTTFPVHLAVSEFKSGDRRMFTGIVRDISTLKHAQDQLLQSARLAAIGQMVTGLAHESRNALQRAQAFLDMLALDLEESPEQLDLTRRTQKAIKDVYRLYEEVRNYAAPIQLECRPCEVVAVCKKVWGYLDEYHKPKEMRLLTEGSQDLRPSVDVHRLEQVLRNIFENAIDACPSGATVTIACEKTRLQDAPAVALSFHDNGPGLETEVHRRLFEPFYTTKQKGTGLGMAICRRLVEAHGGRILADPTVEKGTKVVIVLPMKPTESALSGP